MTQFHIQEVSSLTQVITSVLLFLLPISLTVLIIMTLIYICHSRFSEKYKNTTKVQNELSAASTGWEFSAVPKQADPPAKGGHHHLHHSLHLTS